MGKVNDLIVDGVTWVNVEAPTKEEIELVGQRFHLSQLELEDCLSKRQLQKIEQHKDHLL